MNIFFKVYSRRFFVFFLIFLFSLTLAMYARGAVWEEPTCDPPGCSIEPPLNQGSISQAKSGGLTIGSATVLSNGSVLNIQGSSVFNGLATFDDIKGVIKDQYIKVDNGDGQNYILIDKTGIYLDFVTGSYSPIYAKTSVATMKAIYGEATNTGVGVMGLSTGGIGLYGKDSTTGLAARFDGKVNFNYDTSQYVQFSVDSSSNLTINATNSGRIKIQDDLVIGGKATITALTGQIQSKNLESGTAGAFRCLRANATGIISTSTADCGIGTGGGGNIQSGAANQTLRWNGNTSTWTPSSFLLNTDSKISIGTSSLLSSDDNATLIVGNNNKEGIRIITVTGKSPFVIMNETNDTDRFRIKEDGTVHITSLANCSSISTNASGTLTCGSTGATSKFFGATTGSATGSNGGYAAANALCNTAHPGSHVCTTNEMLNTIIIGGTMPSANTILWIFSGPPGYTAASNDCDGRTSASVSAYGAVWDMYTSSYPNGRGMITKCNNSNKFACCK